MLRQLFNATYCYVRNHIRDYVELGYIPISHLKILAYIINVLFFNDHNPDSITLAINDEGLISGSGSGSGLGSGSGSGSGSGDQNTNSQAQIGELNLALDRKVLQVKQELDNVEYESMGGGAYTTYKRNVDVQASDIRNDINKFNSKPISNATYNELLNRINNIEKYKKYGFIKNIKNKFNK